MGGFLARCDKIPKQELIKECLSRGLPTKGTKKDLAVALDEFEKVDKLVKDTRPPEGGFEKDFESFNLEDLKRLCAALQLSVGGDKEELAARLDIWILTHTARPVTEKARNDKDTVAPDACCDVLANNSVVTVDGVSDEEIWKRPHSPIKQDRVRGVPPLLFHCLTVLRV